MHVFCAFVRYLLTADYCWLTDLSLQMEELARQVQGCEDEMAYEQKEQLLNNINDMPEDDVHAVLEIIKVAENVAESDEIDLGELRSSTMWKLRQYVDEMSAP